MHGGRSAYEFGSMKDRHEMKGAENDINMDNS